MYAAAAVVSIFLAWGALAWFQLRHAALTALALLAPLPVVGLIAFGVYWTFLRTDAWPQAFFFAALCALAICDRLVRCVCDGLAPRKAVRRASLEIFLAMAPVLAASVLSLLGFALRDLLWSNCVASAGAFIAAFALMAAAIWAAAWFPYSESFVTRANLAREGRERRMEALAAVVHVRWAFSVTGIGLVFAALAFFALRGMQNPHYAELLFWPYFAATALFVLAGFLVLARDWRMALALTLSYGLVAAFVFASLLQRDFFPPFYELFTVIATMLPASVPLSLLASRASRASRDGDDLASALALALREEGGIALAMGLWLAVPGLFVTLGSGRLSPLLVTGVASMVGTLLLFPALTVTLSTLFPRYRSVDEVFGKR